MITTLIQQFTSVYTKKIGPCIHRIRHQAIIKLLTSTALGHALYALSLPLLLHLYEPEDMGKLGLYFAFVNFASVGLCLRYDAAIVACKKRRDAVHLGLLASLITVIMSILSLVLLAVLIKYQLLGFAELPLECLPLVFTALLLAGWQQALSFLSLRGMHYSLISRTNLSLNAGRAMGQLGLAALGVNYLGLIMGDLIGRIWTMYYLFTSKLTMLKLSFKTITKTDIKRLLGKFSQFPIYSFPSSLINALVFSLPIPLLTIYYGVDAAGIYFIVYRILTMPAHLASKSVGDVFHSTLSHYQRNKPTEIRALFNTAAKRLSILALFVLLATELLAPWLLPLIFGEKWQLAGTMAAIMAPWTCAQLIVSPLSRVVFVIGGQIGKLVYDVTALLAVIIGLVGSYHAQLPLIQAITVMTALNVLAYGLYFIVLYSVVRKTTRVALQTSGISLQ